MRAIIVVLCLCSCATVSTRQEFVSLDESYCDESRMFPQEYHPETGVWRNMGQPPQTHKGIRKAHIKCHNHQRDLIDEANRRIAAQNAVSHTFKDRVLDGVTGAALWTLVLAGIAAKAAATPVAPWVWLLP